MNGISNQLTTLLDHSLMKARKAGNGFNDLRPAGDVQARQTTNSPKPGNTPRFYGGNIISAQTYYNAQIIGQQTAPSEGKKELAVKNAFEEFIEYMRMTPEERMFQHILGEEGMTKEEFDKLSAKEQEKIMAKVKERLKFAVNSDSNMRSLRNLDVAMFREVQSEQGINAVKDPHSDSELRDILTA